MTFATVVIDLDPNLFSIGPVTITWHGIFSVLGILAAARLAAWLISKQGIPADRIYDAAAWMVVIGLIGARLLFIWENYKLFAGQPLHALYINEGGISQWGGLFGAMLGAYIWARRAHVPFWKIIDAAGPATMIGLAIGRIGDIINGEHHGTETTLPWGVDYVNPRTLGEPGKIVHPEVAYELLWCLLIAGALLPVHQRLLRRLPAGVTGLIYLAVYAAGRFLLSFMRTDSLAFGLRQAQWASLVMIIGAAVATFILLRRLREGRSPLGDEHMAPDAFAEDGEPAPAPPASPAPDDQVENGAEEDGSKPGSLESPSGGEDSGPAGEVEPAPIEAPSAAEPATSTDAPPRPRRTPRTRRT